MKVNVLKAKIVEQGKKMENVSQYIGINRSTLSRKLNEKQEFTLSELTNLSKYLNLSNNEIINIFFD